MVKRIWRRLAEKGRGDTPGIVGRWFYAALAEAAIRPAYGW